MSTTHTIVGAPFKISIPDSVVNQLKHKIAWTRFPDELDAAGWEYGVPLAEIRRLSEYWGTSYDWKVHEKAINDDLPQYTKDIEVDGFGTLNIHFVHQRSSVEHAIPLLFIHGWPGSFLEVQKILPLLVDDSSQHPSFHVVAISLPGFGFSEGSSKKGFEAYKYAEVCDKLMKTLGYSEYVTQGGDWGAWLSRALAHQYPQSVKAVHLNYPRGKEAPQLLKNPIEYLKSLMPYTEAEKAGIKRSQWFQTLGHGYTAIQSTQPQTLGYSLADSPIGLLAWIYEKLRNWSDDYRWSDDEILTWVSIYWFSRAGPAASVRIYYEVQQAGERESLLKPNKHRVPMGFSYFPRELVNYPKSWNRITGNVVFESTHTSGGHFAAHERPALLVDDLRKMFGRGGPAFGIVKGRNGYNSRIETAKAKL